MADCCSYKYHSTHSSDPNLWQTVYSFSTWRNPDEFISPQWRSCRDPGLHLCQDAVTDPGNKELVTNNLRKTAIRGRVLSRVKSFWRRPKQRLEVKSSLENWKAKKFRAILTAHVYTKAEKLTEWCFVEQTQGLIDPIQRHPEGKEMPKSDTQWSNFLPDKIKVTDHLQRAHFKSDSWSCSPKDCATVIFELITHPRAGQQRGPIIWNAVKRQRAHKLKKTKQ